MSHQNILDSFLEFEDGQLSAAAAAEVQAHLDECVSCREAFAELHSLRIDLARIGQEHSVVDAGFQEEVMRQLTEVNAAQEGVSVVKQVLRFLFQMLKYVALVVLLVGVGFAIFAMLIESTSLSPSGSSGRFSRPFEETMVRNAVGNLFKIIEGGFGALLMVGSFVLAVTFLFALNSRKRWVRWLSPAFSALAISCFLLRSSVSLFFGAEYQDYEDSGASSSGWAPSFQVSVPASAPPGTYALPSTPAEEAPPVETNREGYRSVPESGFVTPISQPLSTFSIDVDTASYANLRRFLTSGSLPPHDAVRIEEMLNYFDYDYAMPAEGEPFAIHTEVSTAPWAPTHKLVHIGLRASQLNELPPSNLVFLIDVSGSMNEATKLPLLKQAFHLLVNEIRESDRVAVVAYAGNAGLVMDSTSGEQRELLHRAIDRLESGGSTAGGAGIQLAYDVAGKNFIPGGNNRVILATDGDFNVGISSDADLVKLIETRREEGVFLSVLGFGRGNFQDAKMEQLADAGNGNFFYIDNILEARKVFVDDLPKTLYTVAKDVKIQIELNPAQVKAYRLIGYENRLLRKEDFNNDRKDAGEMGSGQTVTALYEIIPAGSEQNVEQVDALRYRQPNSEKAEQLSVGGSDSSELMMIKVRYKEPQKEVSKLLSRPVADSPVDLAKTSNDLRFAAAVAELGMLLRNSSLKGSSSFTSAKELAISARGDDRTGARGEFVRLIEMAEAAGAGWSSKR